MTWYTFFAVMVLGVVAVVAFYLRGEQRVPAAATAQ